MGAQCPGQPASAPSGALAPASLLVPAMRLGGRVALVTGAQQGIGRAIAIEFGKLGCNVTADNKQQCHTENRP